MKEISPREWKLFRRYAVEFSATMALYAVVLVISIEVAQRLAKGPAQTAVVITPMLPFLLMLATLVRHFRRLDEYVRLQMLENLVIVTGMTADWTFTYGFLEGVGYPKLSMFDVWPTMCWIWIVVSFGRMFLRR